MFSIENIIRTSLNLHRAPDKAHTASMIARKLHADEVDTVISLNQLTALLRRQYPTQTTSKKGHTVIW